MSMHWSDLAHLRRTIKYHEQTSNQRLLDARRAYNRLLAGGRTSGYEPPRKKQRDTRAVTVTHLSGVDIEVHNLSDTTTVGVLKSELAKITSTLPYNMIIVHPKREAPCSDADPLDLQVRYTLIIREIWKMYDGSALTPKYSFDSTTETIISQSDGDIDPPLVSADTLQEGDTLTFQDISHQQSGWVVGVVGKDRERQHIFSLGDLYMGCVVNANGRVSVPNTPGGEHPADGALPTLPPLLKRIRLCVTSVGLQISSGDGVHHISNDVMGVDDARDLRWVMSATLRGKFILNLTKSTCGDA